jgi:hypothetical protein
MSRLQNHAIYALLAVQYAAMDIAVWLRDLGLRRRTPGAFDK